MANEKATLASVAVSTKEAVQQTLGWMRSGRFPGSDQNDECPAGFSEAIFKAAQDLRLKELRSKGGQDCRRCIGGMIGPDNRCGSCLRPV